MKEEMSSFDIAALIPEIRGLIQGARINNVYQIGPATLLFRLRQPSQPQLYLLVEAGKRLHLASYALKRPRRPPDFCMALRKHLRNGRVIEVRQYEFERTVVMEVGTRAGNFQLAFELFGTGNIILVSPQNRILQALVYRRMRDRNVWRGEAFQHAPPSGKNPLKLDRQSFGEIKGLGKLEIVRALTKFLSIGGLYAEEVLLRAQVDKNTPCAALTGQEINGIFDQLRGILSYLTAGKTEPCIVLNDEKGWIDATPIPLRKHAHFKRKQYKTFNEALDDYYTKKGAKGRVAEVAKEADREIARQQRILQRQQRAQKKLREKIKKNRKIGDAIYMHLNELQFLLQRIVEEKEDGKSWEQIVSSLIGEKGAGQVPALYFHSLEPEHQVLKVTVEDATFPLSLRQSVQSNATDYYTKAKRAEKKLGGLKEAIRETQIRTEELQQRQVELVKGAWEPPPKRREKAWYEKFRWFHSSDGFLVIGGRDATTNEVLIRKHVEPHDKVFHADIHGAPFVLIKTRGRSPPEQTVKEAARLAASYSRAWKDMLGAVDVYWVSPQQVSKSLPPGQRLRKGSFMISGPKNYVRNVPLEVAIGIKKEKERLRVIGGPPDAIANQTDIYTEIIPGRQASSRLAKEVQHLLTKRAPKALRKKVLKIPLEEIQRFIPSGRGASKRG